MASSTYRPDHADQIHTFGEWFKDQHGDENGTISDALAELDSVSTPEYSFESGGPNLDIFMKSAGRQAQACRAILIAIINSTLAS